MEIFKEQVMFPPFGIFLLFFLIGLSGCLQKEAESTVSFDVEKGPAIYTLKEAARQAEVEFIFSSELVEGLETLPIKGRYGLSEAFELMLAGSSFRVVQHEGSGVLSIQRRLPVKGERSQPRQ